MIPLPSTSTRVQHSTAAAINRRIAQQTERNIRHYSEQPEQIDRRLDELDREWDIERVLETNASALALGGVALGGLLDRRFLVLPALVAGFLLQHALQGWCPPVPLFRRLGIRTAAEIDHERYALKALRGDFQRVADQSAGGAAARAKAAIGAVRA